MPIFRRFAKFVYCAPFYSGPGKGQTQMLKNRISWRLGVTWISRDLLCHVVCCHVTCHLEHQNLRLFSIICSLDHQTFRLFGIFTNKISPISDFSTSSTRDSYFSAHVNKAAVISNEGQWDHVTQLIGLPSSCIRVHNVHPTPPSPVQRQKSCYHIFT